MEIMSKAERTRQFIIERTAPIFNQKGYAGTSLNDITQATGLTRGGIYGNFSNKDEVALAAFDYNYGQLSKAIRQRMDEMPHPIDKLRVYLTVFADFAHIPTLQFGCPVLNTAIEADDTHEGLRKKAVGAIDSWYKNITGIIKEGQGNQQVQPGIDADEFAGAFIALIEGGIMLAKVTGRPNGLKAAMKQAGKMINDLAV